jgi:hypothetical protein
LTCSLASCVNIKNLFPTTNRPELVSKVRSDPFLDAARNGPKRQRQLLGKERLAAGNLFFFLTAHANGRPHNELRSGAAVGSTALVSPFVSCL